MPVECSRLFQARAVVAPLECRTVAGPFRKAVVLTDVVFELWNHANGFQSRACGFVWNALPGQWSRLLMGGQVDDVGRRYDLESGVLCPAGSTLSVCTCLFVAFPTSTIFALLTGYSCQESHVDVSGVKAVGGDYSIDWLETQFGALDPHDPTGAGAATGDVEHAARGARARRDRPRARPSGRPRRPRRRRHHDRPARLDDRGAARRPRARAGKRRRGANDPAAGGDEPRRRAAVGRRTLRALALLSRARAAARGLTHECATRKDGGSSSPTPPGRSWSAPGYCRPGCRPACPSPTGRPRGAVPCRGS